MLRATLDHAITLASLLICCVPAPVSAEPPGYERWVDPGSDFHVEAHAKIPHQFAGNLNPDIWGKPGFRPVNLVVESARSKIDWQKVQPDEVLHTISITEVPNEGPLEEAGWLMSLEETPDSIQNILENVPARPVDCELYFREESDSDGTQVVARYGCIWVPNSGENESEWDFIPPTPFDHFMTLLDENYDNGKRPYDIEFAVEPVSRRLMGTALLAPINSFVSIGEGEFQEFIQLHTMWTMFYPSDLQALYANGWQLLDFEFPLQESKQDPLASGRFKDENVKFGIFVSLPSYYPWLYEPTMTTVVGPQGLAPASSASRPIDLEGEFVAPPCPGGGICEGADFELTIAWLSQLDN